MNLIRLKITAITFFSSINRSVFAMEIQRVLGEAGLNS